MSKKSILEQFVGKLFDLVILVLIIYATNHLFLLLPSNSIESNSNINKAALYIIFIIIFNFQYKQRPSEILKKTTNKSVIAVLLAQTISSLTLYILVYLKFYELHKLVLLQYATQIALIFFELINIKSCTKILIMLIHKDFLYFEEESELYVSHSNFSKSIFKKISFRSLEMKFIVIICTLFYFFIINILTFELLPSLINNDILRFLPYVYIIVYISIIYVIIKKINSKLKSYIILSAHFLNLIGLIFILSIVGISIDFNDTYHVIVEILIYIIEPIVLSGLLLNLINDVLDINKISHNQIINIFYPTPNKEFGYLNNETSQTAKLLLASVFNNRSNKATLLSGQWGVGKSYLVKTVFESYVEVDMLKYGSGQNIFYSFYQTIVKPSNYKNLRVNLRTLVRNPDLLVTVSAMNLALITFINFCMEIFALKPIVENNISVIYSIIILFNFFLLQVLPFIVFSKDLQSNRFRNLYLSLIVNNLKNEILVIENLDRLNENEVNSVLEIVNYLNEEGIKIIVTADIDYLRDIKEFSYIGNNEFYKTNYLNRYFKEVIVIPTTPATKRNTLLQILNEQNIFVAKYESWLILFILKLYPNKCNIRELEHFSEYYKSIDIRNQVSFELFLYLNDIKPLGYYDQATMDEHLKKDWKNVVKAATNSNLYDNNSQLVSSLDCSIELLLTDSYHYGNIPVFADFSAAMTSDSRLDIEKYDFSKLIEIKNNSIEKIVIPDEHMYFFDELCSSIALELLCYLYKKYRKEAELQVVLSDARNYIIEYSINKFCPVDDKVLNLILCKIYIEKIYEIK